MLDWSKIDNKTILITGATGMVGKTFIELLLKRNKENNIHTRILATGRDKDKYLERYKDIELTDDICFFEHDVKEEFDPGERVDYIFHFASNTHPRLYATDPINTEMANILGTYHLLELASKNKGCVFFLMSTTDVYGDNVNGKEYVSEKDYGYVDCNTLRAGYIEGKRASEALCNAYYEERGVNFFIGRLCRTYGKYLQKNDSRAISQFLFKAVNGEDIVLKSAGDQVYSYLEAEDAVMGMLYIVAEGTPGEAYNIADNEQTMVLKDLANLIGELGGVNVVFGESDATEAKGAGGFKSICLDSTKINSLGWKPNKTIEEGLRETIEFLKNDN